jgi:glucose-1-phosphate thymidylyltransferase
LGDNIFYGHGLPDILARCATLKEGGIIFGYLVSDPERYGVVEFDECGRVIGLEEKPLKPKSRYAVPGLYFYDNNVVEIAASLKPSARGELEITDLNAEYLRRGKLRVELLGRGFAWLDTGTHNSLLQASNYVEAIQARQGLKISCVEEIAYRLGYLSRGQFQAFATAMEKSEYGKYLQEILDEEKPA